MNVSLVGMNSSLQVMKSQSKSKSDVSFGMTGQKATMVLNQIAREAKKSGTTPMDVLRKGQVGGDVVQLTNQLAHHNHVETPSKSPLRNWVDAQIEIAGDAEVFKTDYNGKGEIVTAKAPSMITGAYAQKYSSLIGSY